jgi:hypothetical protein
MTQEVLHACNSSKPFDIIVGFRLSQSLNRTRVFNSFTVFDGRAEGATLFCNLKVTSSLFHAFE